jgi:hypothetical protein
MDRLSKYLLDEPVVVLRMSYVKITGSVNAALLLSQCRYWQNRVNQGKAFYHSQVQWQEEIGLGRYELEKARKELRELGILKEWLHGTPPKLFYFINDAKVEELFDSLELPDLPEHKAKTKEPTVKAVAGVAGATKKAYSVGNYEWVGSRCEITAADLPF